MRTSSALCTRVQSGSGLFALFIVTSRSDLTIIRPRQPQTANATSHIFSKSQYSKFERLSLAKISFSPKTLGFREHSRDSLPHDSLADCRAPSCLSRTEIPPKLALRELGSAPPTARPEPGFQPSTFHANGPCPVGLALAYLGWVENPAVPG